MYGTPAAPGYVPPSGSTAKTLILVGLVLQLIFALIYVFVIGATALIFASLGVGFPVFAVAFIAFGALGFVWLILVWMLSYKPVTEGRYEQARTATLIFAILSLITVHIISGVLYLIAYIKLGDAVREQQMPPPGYAGAPQMATPMAVPPPGYIPAQVAPMAAAAPAAPAAPVCPRCGRPATFVPQYNRYYCYTDQQYI